VVAVIGNTGQLGGTTNVSTLTSTTTSSISTLSTATSSSSTPINSNAPGAASTKSHTTLVGIVVAVSLVVICLIAGSCFWLYAQHTKKSRGANKYQDRFDKAELDAHEVAKHRSLRAEWSSDTRRIPELYGTVERVELPGIVEVKELPALPFVRENSRKMGNFF
jgi:uncharacterized protein HemX